MTNDLAQMHSGSPTIGLLEFAVRVALLGMSTVVRLNRHDGCMYEPDPWAFETPFLDAEWPRR
jgi:hypothetical protein